MRITRSRNWRCSSITTCGDVRSPHLLLTFDEYQPGGPNPGPTSAAKVHSGRSEMSRISTADEPGRYEIRIQGHLENHWAAWFDGLILTYRSDGTTVLHGLVTDQAALHGLLHKVRDVGLPLISVTRVDQPAPPARGRPHQQGE